MLPHLNKRKRRKDRKEKPCPTRVGKPSMECVGPPGFNPAEAGGMYARTVQLGLFTADSFSHASSHLAGLRPLKQKNEDLNNYPFSFLSLECCSWPAYSLVLLPKDHQQAGCCRCTDMLGVLCVKGLPLSTATRGH